MNVLETKFVFDPRQADKQIDATEKRLISLDARLNQFSQNPTFGKVLGGQFEALSKQALQFENVLKASDSGFKAFNNNLLKQTQLEKALEQTKKAKLAVQVEEIRLEREKLALQQRQERIVAKKPDLNKEFRGITSDIGKSLEADLKKQTALEKQISAQSSKEAARRAREVDTINAETRRQAQQQARFRTDIAKRTADAEIAEERRVDRYRQQKNRDLVAQTSFRDRARGAGSEIFGGLGVPLGIAGIGIGIMKFNDLTGVAIDRTNEAIRANRKLASSATEAGIAYDVLSEKNKKTAQIFGLSDVAAARLTSSIQTLANYTGKSSQFDLLQTRLADLAGAKGINSKDLSEMFGSILSGDDNALNRLGLEDPGKLYEKYAKSIGKSADALTQFEKVQAVVNAVIAKGAIFDGTAEERMKSFEGQTAKATATLENLKDNLSQSATGNLFFQNTLSTINGLLETMSFNIDTVRRKLKEGLTPEQIASQELNSFGNQALGAIANFGSGIFGLPSLAYDLATGDDLAFNKYYEGINPKATRDRLVRQRADQLRAQQNLDKSQETDSLEQAGNQKLTNAVSSFQSRVDALLKPASDGIEKAKIKLDDLRKLEEEFTKQFSKFGLLEQSSVLRADNTVDLNRLSQVREAAEKQRKNIETVKRKFYTERAEVGFKRFDRDEDKTLDDGIFFRNALESVKRYLPEDKFEEYSDKLDNFANKVRETSREFAEFTTGANLPDNPFVKVLSDIELLGERAQKRFGALGDEFVKAAEKAERANLTKKLGLQQFQSQSEGLRFNQEARRTAALPATQFASFQRAVELVSKSVDFIAGSGNLNRQIQEARFYADVYNPNNPKSFNEFNRRGANDDISDFGVQIRAAVEDIKNLNSIGLQGTGVYGQGAIADRILSLIPSREELLRRLENPATRGEAQFLLNQQSGALTSKRDFEQRKFNDFVESQKNLEFNKQFAREQIALLDSQTGLDSAERARQLLNIVNPLGDDVDVNLQRRKYQANLEAGAAKINEQKEALEAWKAAAKSTAEINEKLSLIVSEKGVKIDGKNLPSTTVNVSAKDFDAAQTNNSTPTNGDTGSFYDVVSEGFD